jgi:hypothetical protein
LVEFVGAAGVGKSYWVTKVVEGCERRGIEIANMDVIPPRTNPLQLWAIALRSAVLAVALRPNSPSDFLLVCKSLSRLTMVSSSAGGASGVSVCSEGFFQKIRAISRRVKIHDMREIAGMVMATMRPPDIVVVLEARASTIYRQRVARDRDGDRFTMDSVRQDVYKTRESSRAISHIKECLAPSMLAFWVDVEGSAIEPRVAEICEAIMKKLRQQCGCF